MLSAVGKVVRLRQKLVDAADTIKGFFGAKKEQDSAVKKLEELRVRGCGTDGFCHRMTALHG